MADHETIIDVTLKSAADTSGAKQMDDAIQKVGEASNDAAGEAVKAEEAIKEVAQATEEVAKEAEHAEDALEKFTRETREQMEALQSKLDETKDKLGETGEQGGDGMASKLKGKLSGMNWGEMLQHANAIQEAWQTGTAIGEALAGPMVRIFQDGWSWESLLGQSEAELAAEDTANAVANSLIKIREAHAELVATIEAGPADDATQWLKDLDANARRAGDSLKALHEIERAQNKSEAAAVQNKHADRVAEIEASDASDADKKRQKARADAEREAEMLELRKRERAAEYEAKKMAAAQARKRANDTAGIVDDQEARARAAAEADNYADENSAAFEGNPEAQKSNRANYRDSYLRSHNLDPNLGSAKEETAKLEAARKAAEKAREDSRRANQERDTTASVNEIEGRSDVTGTQAKIDRTLSTAERAAKEAEAKAEEKQAKKKRDEEARRLENDARELEKKGDPLAAAKKRSEAERAKLTPDASGEQRRAVDLDEQDRLSKAGDKAAKGRPEAVTDASSLIGPLSNLAQNLGPAGSELAKAVQQLREGGATAKEMQRVVQLVQALTPIITKRFGDQDKQINALEKAVSTLSSKLRNSQL